MLQRNQSNLGPQDAELRRAELAQPNQARRKTRTTGKSERPALGANADANGDTERASRWIDPWLYVLGFLVGLVPIVAVLIRGGSWGAEPTMGLVFCVLFGAALLEQVLRRKGRGHDDCTAGPGEPSAHSGDKQTWSLT
jgi:hypothetical protein